MIGRRLRDWLVDDSLRSLDVDSIEYSLAHRRILLRKVMLRRMFENFYLECRLMDLTYFQDCPGKRVEIGSGSGFIGDVYPDVLTSDIKELPFVDVVFRADQMPFPQASLRAVYAINVFHHLADPRRLFRELLRVLHPGGGIVLIEPFYGLFARWLFRNLHASEGFDPAAPHWESPAQTGPVSNANQALSYIVFERDRKQFEREFPGLALVFARPHTHLWYLVSGGVNFKQLAPDLFALPVQFAERLLGPLNRWIALQHTIVLRRSP